MEYFTLNNGYKMPMAGIGTFMISPADAEVAVESALRNGARLIDTANAYMNESATGRGIKKSGVPREEIFLVSKLWPTVYEKETAVDEMLKRLDTDYVDVLFLHQPTDNWREGYRNIEKAYKEGKAKSLGISNFYDEELDTLLKESEIKPHVMQLEAHPYCTEKEVRDRVKGFGTVLMGWYPLGHGDPGLVREEVFTKLADKYRKSNAQIVLRWAIQMQFITIPGSKNPDHIRDNGDIFDFALTDDEMAEIAKLDGTKKYYNASKEDVAKYATMHLPFEG